MIRKSVKTIVSLLLICMLLPTNFTFAESNSVGERATVEAYEILEALDIIDEESKVDNSDEMTRAEFTVMLCKTLGMDSIGTDSTTAFVDVSADHKAAGAITIMKDLGIVNGAGDNRFYPDEPILFEHAVKMVVTALGYDVLANRKGGALADYMGIATQIDLLYKIERTTGKTLSGATATQLLYNSLFVDLMGQTGFGEQATFEVQRGVNLLYEKFNTVRVNGRIVATEFTSLFNEKGAGKNRITIENTTYLTDVKGVDEWLGYEAECYVRYYNGADSLGTVIYVTPDIENSNILTLKAEDILPGTTDDKIKYYEMPKYKEEEANIKNAYVIYNGKSTRNYNDADFMPESGTVTLIDTDGDGRYDIVNIVSYDICVIDSVSNSRVSFKYGKPYIDIDLSSNTVEYVFIKNGAEIQYNEIHDWDVCALKKTKDNTRYEFYISDTKVSGMVKQMSDEFIQIGEIQYEIGKSYKNALADPMLSVSEPTVGVDFTFSLDMFGRVAASHKEMTPMLGEGYGYLLGANQVKGAFSNEMSFKILTATIGREIKVFPAAEKIKLNDVILEDIASAPAIFDASTKKVIPQLIIYDLNDNNEIKALYTAKDKHNSTLANGDPNPNYDSNYVGYTEDDFTLDFYFELGAYTPGDIRTFRASKWGLDNSTLLFTVPNGPDPKAENCLVQYSGIKLDANHYHHNMYFYDTSPDYNVAIIVRKIGVDVASGIDSVPDDSPVMLVDKTVRSVNSEGAVVPMIYGYTDGNYVGYPVYDEDVKDTGGTWNSDFYGMKPEDLNQGDIIQYVLNNDDDIMALRVLYVHGDNLTYSEKSTTGISVSEASGALYTAYGTVVKRTKDGLVYNARENASDRNWDRKVFISETKPIYIYHSDREKIELATASEINTGDTLLLQKKTYSLGMIVIYR